VASDVTELPAIERLLAWLERNGWAGYDPYDIKGCPLFLSLQRAQGTPARAARRSLLALEFILPRLTRRVAGTPRTINAKAMGLFADAYTDLWVALGEQSHLDRALEAVSWLDRNASRDYPGLSWGYPFDWQSRIFIPAGTPSSVVTSIVGNAYWNLYRATGDALYLDRCMEICTFFRDGLNQDHFDRQRLCFSYTPLDRFHVHNANLFVAEFLIRVGKEVKQEELVNLGMLAVEYSLSEQNDDGSLCYWGQDQDDRCRLDHYHSGFEIRSLFSIWSHVGGKTIRRAVERYYRFYLENLFREKRVPKMTPRSVYPIDIHSCAEAILCNLRLCRQFPEGHEYLQNAVPWVIKSMQCGDGHFAYAIRKVGGIPVKSTMPYIRWGQAWMLRSLSALLRDQVSSRPARGLGAPSSSNRSSVEATTSGGGL
jgi:hypothetical protein